MQASTWLSRVQRPFVLAAFVCWRLTRRCPRQTLCSLAACFGVALFATLFFADITQTPGGESSICFGIGVAMKFGWGLPAQFLTPFAVWGGLMLMTRQPMRWRMA